MTTVSAEQIAQFYPTLQPLLRDIQEMVPAGSSTTQQQSQALTTIANTNTAENQEFKTKLESSLTDHVSKYVGLTHRLNDYNEIYNTNKYIGTELKKADKEMNSVTRKLKNKIHISKQKSQMYEYQRNRLKFLKSLFLVSCFVIIDLLVLVAANLSGLIPTKLFYILIGVSVAIYLFIVYMLVYANSFRSHTDWNKFYWSSVNQEKNSETCK
jgi:uncharacterized membrane protein